jgi:hypothetical protein
MNTSLLIKVEVSSAKFDKSFVADYYDTADLMTSHLAHAWGLSVTSPQLVIICMQVPGPGACPLDTHPGYF